MSVTLQELANRVQDGNCMVFTGAGMSTESGLPDFRSNQGLWHGKDPMKIASTHALANNFSEFTEFYRYRLREKNKYKPHRGHHILAEWEALGYVDGVVTQNVDGFHREAGTQNNYELHGILSDIYCNMCGKNYTITEYMDQNWCSCRGRIRPGIVLFGENLPLDLFEAAIEKVRNCKTLFVIGTSLAVSPANYIPHEAKSGGAEVILINKEPVEHSYMIDHWVKGNAKETLEQIDHLIHKS